MRLLLTVGYYHLLFGEGADTSAIIHGLDGAKCVDIKNEYDAALKSYVQNDNPVSINLVANDSEQLPENTSAHYDQFHKVATERDNLRTELQTLKNKLKKIEEATGED